MAAKQRPLLIVTMVTMLAAVWACAPQPVPIHHWSKPGATYDEFLKDRYACILDARSTASGAFVESGLGAAQSGEVVNSSIFLPCMASHGYTEDLTGPFGPPPGGGIHLH
jgi:hypothetical protein